MYVIVLCLSTNAAIGRTKVSKVSSIIWNENLGTLISFNMYSTVPLLNAIIITNTTHFISKTRVVIKIKFHVKLMLRTMIKTANA